MIRAASHAAFLAPASPIATVATGTPAGIWTIEYSESTPPRCWVGTGTPITGRSVHAATTPGRCAATLAAAMTTLIPRDTALIAHSITPRGWFEAGAGVKDEHATRHLGQAANAPAELHRSVVGVVPGGDDHANARLVAPSEIRMLGQPALRRGQRQGHEIALQAGQHHLRLGVAETGVELDGLYTFVS